MDSAKCTSAAFSAGKKLPSMAALNRVPKVSAAAAQWDASKDVWERGRCHMPLTLLGRTGAGRGGFPGCGESALVVPVVRGSRAMALALSGASLAATPAWPAHAR